MSEREAGMFGVMTREMLSVVDFASLWFDPTFYGIRVTRGDRKPVVVIPGLFGSDLYLQPLRQWLGCVGYEPVASSMDFNAGCIERLRQQLEEDIARHLGGNHRPIALIGHSRGGVLAWALAALLQERVSHLVMLGAPVASFMVSVESGRANMDAGPVGRMLMRASTMVRRILDPECDYPVCDCAFLRDVMRPLSPYTSILSIYGSDDKIVPEHAQITEGETLEVHTSHVGLVYHPSVYRALGRFLASNGNGHDQAEAA
jgi:pimeloyl-ACP methyl ester carboxylesterase